VGDGRGNGGKRGVEVEERKDVEGGGGEAGEEGWAGVGGTKGGDVNAGGEEGVSGRETWVEGRRGRETV